jgi:CRP-like cAMP-binding protein
MTDQALVDALRHSRLATELTGEQAKTLAANLRFRDLAPDEVLVAQGTSDNHLYVVVRGALGVVRNAGTPERVTLLTLTAGDLVGELSFLDETPHYASLVATAETRVFGLERERLESLLDTHPDIVYRVMRAIVRTVHEIQRRISMHSTELMNYIYKQHGRY